VKEQDGAPTTADIDECRSCGLSPARAWDTPDGRVALCGPCAVMYDVGCP